MFYVDGILVVECKYMTLTTMGDYKLFQNHILPVQKNIFHEVGEKAPF